MFDNEPPRCLVPTWRSSWVTAKNIEAKSLRPPKLPNFDSINKINLEITNKVNEFEIFRTVPVASELMFLASSSGNETAAKQAAKVIIENRDKIGFSQLIYTAEKILNGNETDQVIVESKEFVKKARSLLAIDYRNPVLLIDTARELVSLRKIKSASRYVRAAVAMSPTSRFVLRAAARYYVHVGEYEIAHDILRRSPLFKNDPWIQASEIAISTLRGKTSTLAKKAISRYIEVKQASKEFTELTSALGTLEMLAGSMKKAKILFNHSLCHPNDNSLAQAEWAATKLKLIVEEKVLLTPMSFEANSHHAYRRQDMITAINHAKLWQTDEPFSSRPMDAQCFLLSLEGRYIEALEVAKTANQFSTNELSIALNYLFVQIQAGNLDTAMEDFLKLGRHPDINSHVTQYLANAGALAYAFGEFEMARNFYQKSIKVARSRSEPYSEALARAFFARTATQAKDPLANSIVQESADKVIQLPSTGAIYVIQSLVDSVKQKKLQTTLSGRVAKRVWHWDSVTNTLSKLS